MCFYVNSAMCCYILISISTTNSYTSYYPTSYTVTSPISIYIWLRQLQNKLPHLYTKGILYTIPISIHIWLCQFQNTLPHLSLIYLSLYISGFDNSRTLPHLYNNLDPVRCTHIYTYLAVTIPKHTTHLCNNWNPVHCTYIYTYLVVTNLKHTTTTPLH